MLKRLLFALVLLLCLSNYSFQIYAQFPGAGNAIDFQSNREIIAPTGSNLVPSATFSDLTVETWVYWRGQSGGTSGIMEGRGSAFHFEITNNNDPGRLRVRVNNNNGSGGIQVNNVVPKTNGYIWHLPMRIVQPQEFVFTKTVNSFIPKMVRVVQA